MSQNESSSTQTVDDHQQYSLMLDTVLLDPVLDPVLDTFSEDDGFTASEINGEEVFEHSGDKGSADVSVEDNLIIKAESIWVSMPNGEQLHMRHLKAMPVESSVAADAGLFGGEAKNLIASESPKRVFMLHGEVECGRIFYHESGKGLAYHFAQQGYEVFVADLGGRGRSLGCDNEPSSLTVHDIVTDAIPRLLRAATQHCSLSEESSDSIHAYSRHSHSTLSSIAPTIWVAHGFGGVLLSAAWARMSDAERTATQMIFFSARRKLQTKNRIANTMVKAFCHPLTAKLVNWHNAFPAEQLRLGSANENTDWFSVYTDWISNDSWCDAEDGFDYQAALKANPIPPTLHFATTADKIYSGSADVRAFIDELGCHDARIIVANAIANSKRKYDHLSLLLDPAAVNDIFKDATDWLLEQFVASSIKTLMTEAADNESSPVDAVIESEQAVKDNNFDLPFEYSSLDDESSPHARDHTLALSLAG